MQKRMTLSLPATGEAAQTGFAHVKMRLANKGKGDFRAEGNTIWLYDAIAASAEEAYWMGGIAPADFIQQLSAMSGDVVLRINSPGGSVFGAQAMVAAIKQHQGKITAQVDSLAASAASVIAVNCAECVMVPGAMMMIHKAWGMAVGNEAEMRQTADLLSKLDGVIADAYAVKTGLDPAAILDLMAAETWLTAQEAVDAGFADAVMEANTQAPQAHWDLSAFAKAPRMAVAPTGYNDADVAFVLAMIPHHQAAVEMSKTVIAKGADDDVIALAGNIISSQLGEIEELKSWLDERGLAPAEASSMTTENKTEIDAEASRQMRVRMAEAALRSATI